MYQLLLLNKKNPGVCPLTISYTYNAILTIRALSHTHLFSVSLTYKSPFHIHDFVKIVFCCSSVCFLRIPKFHQDHLYNDEFESVFWSLVGFPEGPN